MKKYLSFALLIVLSLLLSFYQCEKVKANKTKFKDFKTDIKKANDISISDNQLFSNRTSQQLFFTLQTVEYDGSTVAAFCSHWLSVTPIKDSKLCLYTWNSENISAGVGAIINEFRKCKGNSSTNSNLYKQCYFLASVGIHSFLEKHGNDKTPSNATGLLIESGDIKGHGYKHFYNVGEAAYQSHSKSFNLSVERTQYKKTDDNGSTKYSTKLTTDANDLVRVQYNVSKTKNVRNAGCNGDICYGTLIDPTQDGEIKVKVEAKRKRYYYAANYYVTQNQSCNDIVISGVQPLIPNKITSDQETKTKNITLTLPATKVSSTLTVKVKGTKCCLSEGAEKLSKAEVTISKDNKKKTTNSDGQATFTDLYFGDNYTITVTKKNYKTKQKNITINKRSQTATIILNKTEQACALDTQTCSDKKTCNSALKEYENNYQSLYDKISSGEIENDCTDNDCSALLDENKNAINYGSCEKANYLDSCETELENIQKNNTNTNDLEYQYNLQQLYKKYNKSELLNYSNPSCSTFKKEVDASCQYTEIISPYKEAHNITYQGDSNIKPICKYIYRLKTPNLEKENTLKNGMLLWSNQNSNDVGNLTVVEDCTYISKNTDSIQTSNFVLNEGYNLNWIPSINLNYIYENGKQLDKSKDITVSLNGILKSGQPSIIYGTNTKDNGTYTKHHIIAATELEYKYPKEIYAYINSGTITYKKDCKNCIKLGYGIPIPLNIQSGNYQKSGFNIDIGDKESVSQTCDYNIINEGYNTRIIDPQHPFGKREHTGNNWCYFWDDNTNNSTNDNAFETVENSEDVVSDNALESSTDIITEHINKDLSIDNRCTTKSEINKNIKNNIVDKPNSSTTNNNDIMYSFTLTPTIIKEIRSYNTTKTYEDYSSINCNKEGQNCISSFITQQFSKLKSSGYCKNNRDILCNYNNRNKN